VSQERRTLCVMFEVYSQICSPQDEGGPERYYTLGATYNGSELGISIGDRLSLTDRSVRRRLTRVRRGQRRQGEQLAVVQQEPQARRR
jgi:hypothetical protein